MRSHTAKRPRLVLAEDHTAVATYLAEQVRDHFDVVGVVADGDALIALVNQLQPDAIVSDVGLKGLDGISATIEIRRRHSEIPIVLVTASCDDSLRRFALDAGASAFLSKMEVGRFLVAVLRRLLQRGDPSD